MARKCNETKQRKNSEGKWESYTEKHDFVRVGNSLQCKNCPKTKAVSASWLQAEAKERQEAEEAKDLKEKIEVSKEDFEKIIAEKATEAKSLENSEEVVE